MSTVAIVPAARRSAILLSLAALWLSTVTVAQILHRDAGSPGDRRTHVQRRDPDAGQLARLSARPAAAVPASQRPSVSAQAETARRAPGDVSRGQPRSAGATSGQAARAGAERRTAPAAAAVAGPSGPSEPSGSSEPARLRPAEAERLAAHIADQWSVPPEQARRIVRAAQAAGREEGVSPTLILAVVARESGFRAEARSPRGAQGLMQVVARHHPDKLQGVPPQALLTPETNIRVGTQVLAEYLERHDGRLDPALRRYSGNATAYPDKVRAQWQGLERARRSS